MIREIPLIRKLSFPMVRVNPLEISEIRTLMGRIIGGNPILKVKTIFFFKIMMTKSELEKYDYLGKLYIISKIGWKE